MIREYWTDRQLRRATLKLVRYAIAIFLVVTGFLNAWLLGRYDVACFDVLMSLICAPEMWLNRE